MALTFRVADGIWDPELDAVRFFAGDDGKVVEFTVSRVTLAALDAGATQSNPLISYNKYLIHIRDVARKVYAAAGRPSPGSVVVLQGEHFR